MATVGGVEGGKPDQTVRAGLAFGKAVGARSAQLDRRVLDARFLPLGGIKDLGLQAAPLGPTDVHPGEHLREVLGVYPAFAGVDHEDGVRVVVRPTERGLQLQGVELRFEGGNLLGDLVGQRDIPVGQLGEGGQVVGLVLDSLPCLDLRAQVAEPPHGALGRPWVVPEGGLPTSSL